MADDNVTTMDDKPDVKLEDDGDTSTDSMDEIMADSFRQYTSQMRNENVDIMEKLGNNHADRFDSVSLRLKCANNIPITCDSTGFEALSPGTTR